MTQTRRLALFGVAGLMTMFVFGGRAGLAAVQQQAKEGAPAAETKAAEAKPAPEAAVPKEESSVTEHTIRIGGQTIPYKATASTILRVSFRSPTSERT